MEFKKVAILGLPRKGNSVKQTIVRLINFLSTRQHEVYVEQRIYDVYHLKNVIPINPSDIGKTVDLAIVVGGDGSMIGANRNFEKNNIPVIGVNRGHLGFLTDLKPLHVEDELSLVLDGKYTVEKRYLLKVSVVEDGIVLESYNALNEAVIHPKKIAHMFAFEIFIDNQFMNSVKADGLIVSTPTGSTAYALSAGGPILTPDIDAFSLIPMFPHTLNNRPIVINDKHIITIDFLGDESSEISIDGQVIVNVAAHQKVMIQKSDAFISLIHPETYSYYNALREKLGWGAKLF